MKERKTNKGAAKRVILKTIGMTLLIDIVVIIFFSIFIFFSGAPMEEMKWICEITLIADIFPICLYGSVFMEQEKNKVKAKTAENIFRKGDTVVYPKVFPKKGHFRQRKFFEEELPKIADYYANLYEDGKIQVVAKIRDLNQILTVEYISKEEFTDAYEVLETTLTA